MEITLNLAWAACSLALIWFWILNAASNLTPRKMQILALAMVVLLLLPVISLSDDLMAMQGPAETDISMRRALHSGEGHPSLVPIALALPEQTFTEPTWSGYSPLAVKNERHAPSLPALTRSLDRRPPPSA
jgi:hypothetical protein